MAKLTRRVLEKALGTSDIKTAGYRRTMTGLRESDRWELTLGLALAAVSYLQRTKPRKQLIHREVISEGAAVVIHHKKSGQPRLEIVKPPKKRRRKAS
jgi:hypothetical protein